jgi:hypothetical protein
VVDGAIKPVSIPAALARFDRWSADANIENGTLELGENTAFAGARKRSVEAILTFGDPPQLSFPPPKDIRPAKRK